MAVTMLTILHYLLCFFLILVILLQAGKGGGLAATFGGGSSETLFGTKRGNILTKATAISVSLFMLTSLLLTIILPKQASLTQKRGFINEEQRKQPGQAQAPAALPAPEGSAVPPSTPVKAEPETSVPAPPQPQAQPPATPPAGGPPPSSDKP